MPDTLTPLAEVLETEWQNGNVSSSAYERLLAHIDALTAAVAAEAQGVDGYAAERDRDHQSGWDAAIERVLAILRGEQ